MKMERNMKWGLALAGGGTRGSYHIGVWRALLELGIDISCVCGTSIGAVNGAFIATGDFDSAVNIWNSVEMKDILEFDEEVKEEKNLFHIKNTSQIATYIYKNRGLDFSPFEKLLNENIDEEKIRKSMVDYGLVTYNISERKPFQAFLDEIPAGKLIDYIIASASFLGIKPKKIGTSLFVDGGVTNNLPVDMLVEREYENIVAVDVGGVGIVKSANVSGKNIIRISPSELLVGIMDFDENAISDNIDQGYFDAKKAFGLYLGDVYYFNSESYLNARKKYSLELLSGIERAGKILDINRFRAYNVEDFIDMVLFAYMSQNKEFDNELFKFADEKYIMSCISNAIVRGNTDLLNNKIVSTLSVGVFEAARAVAYFTKLQKDC